MTSEVIWWRVVRGADCIANLAEPPAMCQMPTQSCRSKVRMSGLSKVEMSAFIGSRGRYGNGANRVEPTRTDRLRVLHKVGQKQLTQVEAATAQ